ncbi:MAG: ABC transporter ATP-binding protein [Anaerolineales bacterium]|nr:ABC transporter ATP-binding protein [Anaerolineales bacterium]MCB8992017.1 ABC transporter ATP-binding protein [Ardenticatenaceae bacterium]MCB9004585.1 ABC transporter ATP-binding protein [Ardenticatenaceae bacterium]
MARWRHAGRNYESDPDKKAKRLTRESLQVYKRLLAYVRPYRRAMVFAIITLLFSSVLGLVLPLVVRNLVDIVFVDKSMSTLNRIAVLLLLVFVVQAIFSFMHRLSLAFVGEKAVADIRVQVYSHLQSLSLKFYADRRTGEIVSRLTNDVSLLQSAITNNLVALLQQAVTLIGAAILLFVLDWRLTTVILLGIPVMSLTMVALGRKIRVASKQVQDALAEAANVLEETTAGIRIVKSFTREAYEIGRFAARVQETFEAAMYRAKVSAVLGPSIGFMAFFSITITLWFGSFEVIDGRLTAGGLVAYLIYTMMVAAPIASLAGLYAQFQSALGATERLFELLDTPPEIVDGDGKRPLPPVKGTVEFEDVHFEYSNDLPVLRGVSFRAEPGQVIALVGPSGAGKSTLINLIPRFYDVIAGSIRIDGIDVRDVNVKSLREQIGIVPQETILFSDTVEANIRYGKLAATPQEIEAAARAANAHEFILHELGDGYETAVGERGVKLSGGQRQRIAIARAVLKDPRILILDEATSSLDSESEALVQEALERLMHGRTSFVIAHRLSTVVNADWVLVVEQGQVVEQGTHADLLGNPDGLYTRLHQMQFGAAESAKGMI